MPPPEPHDVFQLFTTTWPRETHSLSYIGHGENFPIGYIGGGEISADEARQVVEREFDGKIMHLALAPHDGTNGVGHNGICPFITPPAEITSTHVGDAIIVRKGLGSIRIDTFVGDCAVIICTSNEWLGFIHCGMPELIAEPNILDRFQQFWPVPMAETSIFIGPCISGKWFSYDPEKIPDRYKSFVLQPGEDGNAFDDQCTFGLNLAIQRTVEDWHPMSLSISDVDPFQENVEGRNYWASARYAWFQKIFLGIGDGLSPRDCAMLLYRPQP